HDVRYGWRLRIADETLDRPRDFIQLALVANQPNAHLSQNGLIEPPDILAVRPKKILQGGGAADEFAASGPRDAAALFAQEIPGFRDDEDHALFVLLHPLNRIRQDQLLYALVIRAKVNDVHV